MRSRLYLFALLAVLVLAAPPALAQGGGQYEDGGPPRAGWGTLPTRGSTVIARIFTSAVLNDAVGNPIGKVKTATVQTTNQGIVQGLRVSVRSLTPGADYALVIDGTLVGTGTADANGGLQMKFLSPTRGRAAAIPDAIKPVAAARTVQIYEASSQRLAASGQFQTDGTK